MLIIGFDGEPELIEKLRQLAPTVSTAGAIDEVNQAEYDLLVTDRLQSPWHVGRGLYPVRVRSDLSIVAKFNGTTRIGEFDHTVISVISGEFHVAGDLAPPVAALTKGSLFRAALARHEAGEAQLAWTRMPLGPNLSSPPSKVTPFVLTSQGSLLAGRYERSNSSECWLLPHYAPDFSAWVAAAIGELRERQPDRFPSPPSWRTSPQWQTPIESELVGEIQELGVERDRLLGELAQREARLVEALADAAEKGDAYERGLLTEQADDLVRLVARALEELGFDVTSIDEDRADRSQKLEDLQVRHADDPGWIALVEVRGYTRGAQSNDFQRIGRFVERYIKDHGVEPSARWYIVNQFRDDPPDERPIPLASAQEDVEIFGEAGGLVIDTKLLFRLLVAVRRGEVTKSAVSRFIRGSSGLLEYPESREPDC